MESQRVSHYEVGRMLGRGGMGEVFEAVDLNLDRRVALKFIAPELAADPESLRRFEREARSAAALTHAHIATLYEFEREGPRPFIAMELVSGQTLRARLGRGPLPVAEALAIARDVAGALALAHRRGIVHRDIKPENLMFDEQGAIKVMDFGLARAAQASRLTMTGTTLGTAGYMAPEAIRGEPGVPADVFALGVVLHEMIAGELPFKGDNPLALMYTIANEAPTPLRAARPETPEAAESLVLRILEKDPAARPDAAAVARELGTLTGAPASGVESTTAEVEVVRVPAGLPVVLGPAAPAARGRGRRWSVVAAAVLAALAWPIVQGTIAKRNAAAAVRLQALGARAEIAGRAAEARTYYRGALEKDPKNGAALNNLALIYLHDGLTTTAESLFFAVLRHSKDLTRRAGAYHNLAEINMRDRAWTAAVTNLKSAFALDSSYADAYNNLGYALIQNQQATEALALLRRGLMRFPAEPYLWKNAALAALQVGDWKQALADLDRALALDPRLTTARGLRAQARAQGGDPKGARADWAAYLAVRPDSLERIAIEATLVELGALPEPGSRAGSPGGTGP